MILSQIRNLLGEQLLCNFHFRNHIISQERRTGISPNRPHTGYGYIESGEKQKNSWVFQNVIRYLFQDEILKMEFFEQWRIETKKLPTVPFENPISPHHQPIFDLYEDTIKLQGEGLDVTRHWVEFYQKTAYPFQIIIMMLIGLGLSSSYNRRSMVAESVSISFLLGILYWMFNQISMAVGSAGILAPFFAAWSGNLVFLTLALWLLNYNRV